MSADTPPSADQSQTAAGEVSVVLAGSWVSARGAEADRISRLIKAPATGQRLWVDASRIDRIDTAGAWILSQFIQRAAAAGGSVHMDGLSPAGVRLLELVTARYSTCRTDPPGAAPILRLLNEIGRGVVQVVRDAGALLGFFGLIVATLLANALRPWHWRITATVAQMERVGLTAVLIVLLLSFLVGVVLAYQGALQMRQFGAEIFVVDLVAIAMLREIAILITAILIAGRSGSAFTAQLGAMVANQEIDAMRTIGVDPIEALVLPRLFALALMLPLLGFLAAMAGLLGGGVMAWLVLNIPPGLYLDRLSTAADASHLAVGMIKAPVFAVVIALVGCFHGLSVGGSAEAVGRATTTAVVQSIFLVIVLDAGFSILFAQLGI